MLPHPHSPGAAVYFPGKGGWPALGSNDFGGIGHGLTLPVVTKWRKLKITHGNVTQRNVARMDELDRGWENLESPWERLRWARLRWQRKTGVINPKAAHAAEALGIEQGTYRAYERPPGTSKHSGYDHQLAIQFGRKFKVSWIWLLTGEGTPFDHRAPTQERVVQAMASLDDDRQEEIARMIEAFAQHARR